MDNPLNLTGKVALVTGGRTGIGKAIAHSLADAGAKVVIFSRNAQGIRESVEAFAAERKTIYGKVGDVRDVDCVQILVDEVTRELGGLDILVNNAAGNFLIAAEELTPNGWRSVIDIVLNGTFWCSQAAARYWIREKKPGNIINIVGAHTWTGGPGTVHSASSKAGVLAMTKTLAVEWARFHIRVNAIAPGLIKGTGGFEKLIQSGGDIERDRQLHSIPMERFGEPQEIGDAALFLASPMSDYITGECITVDGGQWLNKGRLHMLKKGTIPRVK